MNNKDLTTSNWNLVQAFLALNRYGNYETASERENIDDSSLRRRISQLEAHFGRQLFVKSEGGWTIAPDMSELVTAARQMEDAAAGFFQALPSCKGDVTISILDAFGLRLAHVFYALRQKYPSIALHIISEARFANLGKDKVDIAIRLARPVRNNSSLRIRKLGDVSMNAYASTAYIERMGRQVDEYGKVEHSLLGMRLQFPHDDHSFPYADIDWEDFGLHGKTYAKVDSLAMLQQMCELGSGIALLPVAIAHGNPRLRLVRENCPSVNTELWFVSRLDMRAQWQLDFADMLQAELVTWAH